MYDLLKYRFDKFVRLDNSSPTTRTASKIQIKELTLTRSVL
jgi:hypothetical protein